jgi:ADP-heptose:LPS heptosyltransferase
MANLGSKGLVDKPDYIRNCYARFLGRVPDPEGFQSYCRNDMSHRDIENSFRNSPEHRVLLRHQREISDRIRSRGRARSILFYGAYGNGNLGDILMPRFIAADIESRFDVSVFFYSDLNIDDYDADEGRKLHPFPRSVPGFFNGVVTSVFDGIAIGGGGLLEWPHDPIWDPDWPHLLQSPFAIVGCGAANPLDPRLENLVSMARVVTGRDQASVESLRRQNPSAFYCPDPLLSLLNIPRAPNGLERRGIAYVVRAPASPAHRAIAECLTKDDAVISFSVTDDWRLLGIFPSMQFVSDLDAFLKLIDRKELVVAERYHGVICALHAGLPVQGLVRKDHNEQKIRQLFQYMGAEASCSERLLPRSEHVSIKDVERPLTECRTIYRESITKILEGLFGPPSMDPQHSPHTSKQFSNKKIPAQPATDKPIDDIVDQADGFTNKYPDHRLLGNPQQPWPANRILVLALAHIGDFILSVRALELLRTGLPESHITMVCSPLLKDWASACGFVDHVITLEFFPELNRDWNGPSPEIYARIENLRLGPFDIAIDLRHDADTRPCLYRVDAKFRAGFMAPIETGYPWLDLVLPSVENIAVPESNRTTSWHAEARLALLTSAVVAACIPRGGRIISPEPICKSSDRPVAVLSMSAGDPIRYWPIESFAQVGNALIARGHNILILGGPAERVLIKELVARFPMGRATCQDDIALKDLPALLASSQIVVGNGTGVTHLSAIIGIPTVVVLTGVARNEVWRPIGPRVICLSKPVPCSPCGLRFPEECDRGVICQRAIGVEEVIEAVDALLPRQASV